jgi:hypothetical protein
MQFLRTPKEREPPSPGTGLGGGYYELSMYREPPAGEVALEEFEKVALDRLRSATPGGAAKRGRAHGAVGSARGTDRARCACRAAGRSASGRAGRAAARAPAPGARAPRRVPLPQS